MTSQKFPLQNGTSHRASIFTPWNRAKIKNHFLCLKTFRNKKIRMFTFSRSLISKTTAASPWLIDFVKIQPKCV